MSSSDNMPASLGTTLEDTTTTTTTISVPLSNPIQAQTLLDASKNDVVVHNSHIPSVSASAVLGESASMPPGSVECRGYDFNQQNNNNNDNDVLDSLMQSFVTTGFQATQLGLAVERVRELRAWRLSQNAVPSDSNDKDDDELLIRNRHRIRARIFLAYTSNQISSGQREVLRFLVQHGMVDCLITTAGGIEEDLIKCLRPTYMGDFRLSGKELRSKGINRIGNLLVPNRILPRASDPA